jgi:enoyl-CoA hydratase
MVSKVVPHDSLMETAIAMATQIASLSKVCPTFPISPVFSHPPLSTKPLIMLTKEAVNHGFETFMQEGCNVERRLFHSTFALKGLLELLFVC